MQWPEGDFVFRREDDMATRYAVRTLADMTRAVIEARHGRRWSQRDLADHSGLGKNTVQAFETGSAWSDIDNVLRMLIALDLDVEVVRRGR